jgi:cholesterol oxidase
MGDRLRYLRKFGQFFSDILFDTYGDSLAGQSYFIPEGPPRPSRQLRTAEPEVYRITTDDDVYLRLTRYRGGEKGPVILAHGLGVSGKIFSTDMIDTNLVEFLYERDYDVWQFDFRASIDLPASGNHFSADDIAKYDYPAAEKFVREKTGSDYVQMVVHCYGATAWTISMLGGWLKNVRSAVVSQVSTHNRVPFLTKMKTGLHVPEFLSKLGVDSLTAYVDKESNWVEKLFDDALNFYPYQDEEECNNPVCHRITFLYGHLYEHDQLNDLTHRNLHELFGVANIKSFEHLALMSRKGHVVDYEGNEAYLPYADRMAIPITFISGGENECFLPVSTEMTLDFLKEKNGNDLYNRVVVPNYGHIDCIFGKDASKDIYPHIVNHLDKTQ